jgi:hypothetical protein
VEREEGEKVEQQHQRIQNTIPTNHQSSNSREQCSTTDTEPSASARRFQGEVCVLCKSDNLPSNSHPVVSVA